MSGRRTASLALLSAALVAWGAGAGALPDLDDRWDVALTAAVLIPVTFAVPWLALPLMGERRLWLGAIGVAALAVGLDLIGATSAFDVAKLFALTLGAFAFLALFEGLLGVVLVACLIPWVDIASVLWGPTKVVVEEKPGLFERISVGFRLPGEADGARIGPPDVLFFALFLGAATTYGLRTTWTWLAMTALLSATLVATYVFDLGGLPALPAVALGFLLPNADLLWRSFAAARRERR
jgi:hypothetical protein